MGSWRAGKARWTGKTRRMKKASGIVGWMQSDGNDQEEWQCSVRRICLKITGWMRSMTLNGVRGLFLSLLSSALFFHNCMAEGVQSGDVMMCIEALKFKIARTKKSAIHD